MGSATESCAGADRDAQIQLALFAALVLDVQVPVLIFSQPASVEHFEADLGILCLIAPLTFLALIGVTAASAREPGTPMCRRSRGQ